MKKSRIFAIILALFAIFVCFFQNSTNVVFASNTTNMVVTFGESSAKILPDCASIDCVINITNKSQDTAKNLAFDKYENVKNQLLQIGITKQDINLTHFSAYPSFDYTQNKKIVGYTTSLMFNCEVSKIDNIKLCIDKITQVDDVSINNINFKAKDCANQYQQLLVNAVNNAKQKAKTLLSKQDIKIISINEIETYNDYCCYKNYTELETLNPIDCAITITAKVKLKAN